MTEPTTEELVDRLNELSFGNSMLAEVAQRAAQRLSDLERDQADLEGKLGEATCCSGCGTTKTIAQIRRDNPGAIACCPERKMLTARQWFERAEAAESKLGEARKALEEARDQFFNLIADARRWDEDVDGDADDYGRPVVTITYFAEFLHSSLDDLLTAFGIKRDWAETAGDALERAIEASMPSSEALKLTASGGGEDNSLSQGAADAASSGRPDEPHSAGGES